MGCEDRKMQVGHSEILKIEMKGEFGAVSTSRCVGGLPVFA